MYPSPISVSIANFGWLLLLSWDSNWLLPLFTAPVYIVLSTKYIYYQEESCFNSSTLREQRRIFELVGWSS